MLKGNSVIKRSVVLLVLVVFVLAQALPSYAQGWPAPVLEPHMIPPHLTGLVIDFKNPFDLDFIVQPGSGPLTIGSKKKAYLHLVKYFLASMAIPDKDQWVNLSPYEKDRMIPDNFALTLMGKDLLAQDYMLKQIASGLIHPQTLLGKSFWDKVYASVYEKFGTTDVPSDVFNKVWVIPDRAVLYEKGGVVYIMEHHLKVMLDSDYTPASWHASAADEMIKALLRKAIIPVLEKEVNEGGDFAVLRQIYSGMLLATWYKRVLKGALLNQIYTDRSRVKGVDHDPSENQKIYNQYIEAFRQGAFNLIKEDVDPLTREMTPRRYFSGGLMNADAAMFDDGKVGFVKSMQEGVLEGAEAVRVRLTKVQGIAASLLSVGGQGARDGLWKGRDLWREGRDGLLKQKLERLDDFLPALAWNTAREGVDGRDRADQKFRVFKKIGAKARVAGDTLYYPFSGGDADDPFGLSSQIRHVMAMGQEAFGSPGQLKGFFGSPDYSRRSADRDQDGYDHGARLKRLGFIGGLALSRIISMPGVRILGIKYYDMDDEGEIVFRDVNQADFPVGSNAVIVFKDKDSSVKAFWYCQHQVSQLLEGLAHQSPFRRMINRSVFQTMIIKAAQSFLFEGVMGLNADTVVGAPARQNNALVLTDVRNGRDTQSGGLLDAPQPVFAVKPASVSWLSWVRFGYGRRVYYGRAREVLADMAKAPFDVWKAKKYVPDILVNWQYRPGFKSDTDMMGIRFTALGDGRKKLNEVKGTGAGFRTATDNRIELFWRGGRVVAMKNVFDVEVLPQEKLAKIHYVDAGAWFESRLNFDTGGLVSERLGNPLVVPDNVPAAGFLKGGIDFEGKNFDVVVRGDGKTVAWPASWHGALPLEIEGLAPQILEIRPAMSLDVFEHISAVR